MYSREDELLIPIPEDQTDYEWYLNSVKTAMFLLEWIGENDAGIEASEDRIETLFNLGPGDIRNKVETSVWILYAMRELARLFGVGMAKDIDIVTMRVERGIKKELIPLISVKGIGRVRARRLFDSGYTDLDILRKATLNGLSSVEGIGRQIALQIQNQLRTDGEIIVEEDPVMETDEDGQKQSNLLDFS
jgi:helicase